MAKKVTPKRKTTLLTLMKQVGTSVKEVDKKLTALAAGKRKTANPHYYHGKIVRKSTTYTERRKNRSDGKGKI